MRAVVSDLDTGYESSLFLEATGLRLPSLEVCFPAAQEVA